MFVKNLKEMHSQSAIDDFNVLQSQTIDAVSV